MYIYVCSNGNHLANINYRAYSHIFSLIASIAIYSNPISMYTTLRSNLLFVTLASFVNYWRGNH